MSAVWYDLHNIIIYIQSTIGTKKVRQAATKENCTIVHPDWLWVSWYNFERQNEIKHLLTSQNEIPEPKKGAPPVLQMCGVSILIPPSLTV